MFHSFRAIFVQIAGKLHVKKASKVERKRAARSSFNHSFFLFFFISLPKSWGKAAPARGHVWCWDVGTAGCPILPHCCWEVPVAQHRCKQRNPSSIQEKRLKWYLGLLLERLLGSKERFIIHRVTCTQGAMENISVLHSLQLRVRKTHNYR